MGLSVAEDQIISIGNILCDTSKPLTERFRALFTLKNIGGQRSIDVIGEALVKDESALLKHECAYCLGQMGDPHANTILIDVLSNTNEHPMVRHEAGEALGAIGHEEAIEPLKKFSSDSRHEVAETCKLALNRIEWLKNKSKDELNESSSFTSVDPAPPSFKCESVDQLKSILIDPSVDLFERYRAMFKLRNLNTNESALALAQGLNCSDSALFRHEIAFVLGQMQNPVTVNNLGLSLENKLENEMVRHECAEALGAIANDEANEILKKFIQDEQRVVRESVEIALDISDYSKGNEFQYANSLYKIS